MSVILGANFVSESCAHSLESPVDMLKPLLSDLTLPLIDVV